MKNKKLFIIIFVIIIICIAIFIIGKEYIIEEDFIGRKIVTSSEDLSRIEENTPIVIAISNNANEIKEDTENRLKADKKLSEEELNSTTIPQINYNMNEEKLDTNDDVKDLKSNLKIIMKKYFGEEYANEILERINKEILENTGDYKVPDASIELLNKILDLYNETDITDGEKKVIEEFVKQMDLNFIEDENVLSKIYETNIIE